MLQEAELSGWLVCCRKARSARGGASWTVDQDVATARMIAMEATIFTGYDHLLPHAEKVKVEKILARHRLI